MPRLAAIIVSLLFAFGALAPASAAVADSDRAAIQSIISGQVEAFQRDDGAAAYGYASPMIQNLFQNPDIFMGMVQQGYQPVYRPQSFTFGPLVETERGIVQRAFVVGPDGQSYVAEYTMQRQPDGTWKINGCTLVKDNSPTI